MALVLSLPGLLFGWLLLRSDIDDAYVKMIFCTMIPTIYAFFAFFFLADLVNKKIGILKIIPDDNVNSTEHLVAKKIYSEESLEGGHYENSSSHKSQYSDKGNDSRNFSL